jgi:hypothetical protein
MPRLSANEWLKRFGQAGTNAIMKELHQLITMNLMSGCLPGSLSAEQKRKAI